MPGFSWHLWRILNDRSIERICPSPKKFKEYELNRQAGRGEH